MIMNCRRWPGIVSFAGLLALAASAHAAGFVHETVREFFADGDFNGDGRRDLALVDKATGKYRLAFGQPNGAFAWADSRASGITDTRGFAVGRFLKADRDAL